MSITRFTTERRWVESEQFAKGSFWPETEESPHVTAITDIRLATRVQNRASRPG